MRHLKRFKNVSSQDRRDGKSNVVGAEGSLGAPASSRAEWHRCKCFVATTLNWDIKRRVYAPFPARGIGAHRSLIPERRDYFAGGYPPSRRRPPPAAVAARPSFRILALVGGGAGGGWLEVAGVWKRGTTMLCSPTTDSVLTNRLFTVWPPGISIPVA